MRPERHNSSPRSGSHVYQRMFPRHQRNTAANNGGDGDAPLSMKYFVRNAFNLCSSKSDMVLMEKWLKSFLAKNLPRRWEIDWERHPLPTINEVRREYGDEAPKYLVAETRKRPMKTPEIPRKISKVKRSEERKNRSGGSSGTSSPVSSSDFSSKKVVVGSSMDLEKPFLRLTSEADSSRVRPLDVLQKSLSHTLAKWKSQSLDYLYICEQLKSIRQDLSVQHIEDEFTVRVYELHSRLALTNDDIDEMNACNAKLSELYLQFPENSPVRLNELEFTVYRLMSASNMRNTIDFSKIVSQIDPDLFSTSSRIRLAMKLESAISSLNSSTFFAAAKEAETMGPTSTLVTVVKRKFRSRYIACCLKSIRAGFTVGFVQDRLRFPKIDECYEFLVSENCVLYVSAKECTASSLIDVKRSVSERAKKREQDMREIREGSYVKVTDIDSIVLG